MLMSVTSLPPPPGCPGCSARTHREALRFNPIGSLSYLLIRLGDWIALRSTDRSLRRLDDRTLKDIGLDRSEIDSVLRNCAGERRQTIDCRFRSTLRL